MNCSKKGRKYAECLARRQARALQMFAHFVEVATVVRKGGGTISFEWPRYCLGWSRQPVLNFISSFGMSPALIDRCSFGMQDKAESIKKQWRIVTDHKGLLADLAPWVCSGKHKLKEISGGLTPRTAYYNSLMCHVILNAIFPFKMSAHVPALPCLLTSKSPFPCRGTKGFHRDKDIPSVLQHGGLVSGLLGEIGGVVELDESSEMYEAGDQYDLEKSDVLSPAAVHQLLSRKEMLESPEAMQAVKKEASGLESKGTWDSTSVREAEAVKQEARRTGITAHFL
jgi:hypothetical protein